MPSLEPYTHYTWQLADTWDRNTDQGWIRVADDMCSGIDRLVPATTGEFFLTGMPDSYYELLRPIPAESFTIPEEPMPVTSIDRGIYFHEDGKRCRCVRCQRANNTKHLTEEELITLNSTQEDRQVQARRGRLRTSSVTAALQDIYREQSIPYATLDEARSLLERGSEPLPDSWTALEVWTPSTPLPRGETNGTSRNTSEPTTAPRRAREEQTIRDHTRRFAGLDTGVPRSDEFISFAFSPTYY